MNKEAKIITIGAIVVIVGFIILSIFAPMGSSTQNTPVSNTALLVRSDSHMTGTTSAKVQLVEFGDYQCPSCGVAEPIISKILSEHKNNPDFNFVFRNFPLPQHANALVAAEAAEAAGEQGKYWEMNELLYTKQNDWSESSDPISIFVGYAKDLGLNTGKFKQEVIDNKFADFISADKYDGDLIGINATPTFYLNGVLYVKGVPDQKVFEDKINELLK